MTETLSVEKADHVTTVTLQIPTMPPRFFTELGATFREIAADREVRAVILRSKAKHFSYGLDLAAAMQTLGGATSDGGASSRLALHQHILEIQAEFGAVAACPVPVIAAIHGWCIGGGVDLVSACDLRLATRDSKFSVRETKIAIVADLGSLQRLPRLIGQANTRELAFTGKDIDAARAREMGLLNQVVDDTAALGDAALAMAREIAHNPPLTVRGVKRVLDFGEGKPMADGLQYVAAWNSAFLASEDLGEALAAFGEKRPPRFKGR
jgi:enoyl-CoA hydratase